MTEQAQAQSAIDLAWMVCRNKRTFPYRHDAVAFMRKHMRRNGRQHPYKCEACGKWHLTTRYHKQ